MRISRSAWYHIEGLIRVAARGSGVATWRVRIFMDKKAKVPKKPKQPKA
jgi:hypothetical protein